MISVVAPAYNEARNLQVLIERIERTLGREQFEILLINDGSTDHSKKMLQKLQETRKFLHAIHFNKNRGQTAALLEGFRLAKGEIIVSMDADLQNHPEDVPRLIAKLDEGFDVVCGWRWQRKDPLISKNIPSLISNCIVKKITGVQVQDIGCTLRAYKKECLQDIELKGQMHRFIPIILAAKGYRIGQIKVGHSPRTKGKSRYGLLRIYYGISDLLSIMFSRKQRYFFRGSVK